MTKPTATALDIQIGERIRIRRRQLGLTQTDLAQKLGIAYQQVQKNESGMNRVSAGRLPHVASALDVHVGYFFPPDCDNPNDRSDFSAWRANVRSRARALLMLFLFSDVGPRDAPTRIRVGSHIDMARHLALAGEAGVSHKDMMLDQMGADRPEALATGEVGDVYLCHPFLVHAAQRHQGTTPRFMAQPPLHRRPEEPLRLDLGNGNYSPIEIAIRQALQGGGLTTQLRGDPKRRPTAKNPNKSLTFPAGANFLNSVPVRERRARSVWVIFARRAPKPRAAAYPLRASVAGGC